MNRSQRFAGVAIAFALVLTGAVGALYFASSGAGPSVPTAHAQERVQDRGISVYGEGQISVPPDVANVILGIELEGTDLDSLRDDADSRMNDVVDALQDLGIAEEDIRTVTYDIRIQNDDYFWPPRPMEEPAAPDTPVTTDEDDDAEADDAENDTVEAEASDVVYVILQQVQVRISDIDTVGEVIDTALDSGANRVSSIWFEVEDRQDAIDQARVAAVEHALQKAEHLAELTGVSLGAPLRIEEYSPSGAPIRMSEFAEEAAMDADGMARIEPGESIISVTVYITYDID